MAWVGSARTISSAGLLLDGILAAGLHACLSGDPGHACQPDNRTPGLRHAGRPASRLPTARNPRPVPREELSAAV